MWRRLHTTAKPLNRVILCEARPQSPSRRLLTTPSQTSTSGGSHDAWRVRVFDVARARSYAIDFGHFPAQWFLGPSAYLTLSRSDDQAGRPNSFKHIPKQLVGSATPTLDLSHNVDISASDGSVSIQSSERIFSVRAEAYGAALTVSTKSHQTESLIQLSRITVLGHKNASCLSSQTLRSDQHLSLCQSDGYLFSLKQRLC